MKSLIIYTTRIILILLIGLQSVSAQKLTCTISDVADGTKFYLANQNVKLDSAILKDGKMHFSLIQLEEPANVILHSERFENYRFLWVEKVNMELVASNGNFRYGKVIGGALEKHAETLALRKKTIETRIDSLVKIASEKNHEDNKKVKEARKEMAKVEQGFVYEYPFSLVSAHVLDVYKTTWEKEVVNRLYDNFIEDIKNTKSGVSIREFLEQNINPEIGEAYVDFQMQDLEGNVKNLSSLMGKVTLLEFWASSCGPCRKENPKLVELYNEYKDRGFQIVGVSLDTNKEHWEDAINKDKLPWVQLSDLKGNSNLAGNIYGVSGIPDNYLIDENGTIIGRYLRGEKLRQKIEEIF